MDGSACLVAYEVPIRFAAPAAERPETGIVPRSERRRVELRAYAVRFDDSIIEMRVLDMSYDGCGIETTARLIPGELLKLTVLGRGIGKATVRWYKNRRGGLLFDPHRSSSLPRERAAERLEVCAEISLRRSGKASYRVQTSDITRFGCACEFVERPNINEKVWVKLAGLETLEADVCWIGGSSLGLKFKTPLHPAVFELLLSRWVPSAIDRGGGPGLWNGRPSIEGLCNGSKAVL
jgi:hypothetical protein